MHIFKKFLLLSLLALWVTSCATTTITNLTPSQLPRNATGQYLVGGLILLLLAAVFVGMGVTVLAVVQGEPPASVAENPAFRDSIGTDLPILLLMALVLLLGLYIPGPLEELLKSAVNFVENKQ